jgi:branched-chain amino acid transport system ATP-binding protein
MTMNAPTPAADGGLVVTRITAGYGHIPVLNDLSFRAAAGECIALLGPNGVGKTTTMRVLTGLVRPTGGTITWEGKRIDGIAPHKIVDRGIAIVPEGRRLYGGMSVDDNLRMGAYHLSRTLVEKRLHAIYERFPLLAERRHQLAATMSGGQQQICAIGRALMSEPRLLLIDELSLGLSPPAIADVVAAVKLAIELLKPTVIVVDQDAGNAAKLAGRGYFIERGTMVAEGALADLMQVERIKELYFSADAPAAATAPTEQYRDRAVSH